MDGGEGNDREKQANRKIKDKNMSRLLYLCLWHYSIICSSRQVHIAGLRRRRGGDGWVK